MWVYDRIVGMALGPVENEVREEELLRVELELDRATGTVIRELRRLDVRLNDLELEPVALEILDDPLEDATELEKPGGRDVEVDAIDDAIESEKLDEAFEDRDEVDDVGEAENCNELTADLEVVPADDAMEILELDAMADVDNGLLDELVRDELAEELEVEEASEEMALEIKAREDDTAALDELTTGVLKLYSCKKLPAPQIWTWLPGHFILQLDCVAGPLVPARGPGPYQHSRP